ncbi:unnamed protein product [Rotaria sp. Silwood1]|nr:unnamed protein product [Rotaria sp. Silwood1]
MSSNTVNTPLPGPHGHQLLQIKKKNTVNTPASSNDLFYDAVNTHASLNGLTYDAVIHIGKLNDLLKDGWKVTTPDASEASEQRSILHYKDSLLVGVLGSYNRGSIDAFIKLGKALRS